MKFLSRIGGACSVLLGSAYAAGTDTDFGGTWYNNQGMISRMMSTLAGVKVTPKSALSLSVYYASIRNIAEDIAKIPFITYARQENGDKTKDFSNPVYALLEEKANDEQDAQSVRELLTHWAVGWGNGLAEIQWDGRNNPVGLWPIHPSRVRPDRLKKAMGTKPKGTFYYKVNNNGGTSVPIWPENMLHIKGLGSDGYWGWSVLQFQAESVGLGLAAQRFGSTFFGNGATVSGTLEHPGKLSDEAYKRLRESWAKKHQGVNNSHNPAILEEGVKWNKIAVPPNEAQFLETRQFNVEDICRWFRMPIHKVQHHVRAKGWASLDASNTDYVTDCLLTWMVRWENEVSNKLFPGDRQHFAEHLVAGLLRGDMRARSAFYKDQFGIGALNINEIRQAENRNSIGDDGDTYFVPSNMTPVNIAKEGKVNSAA